MFALSFLNLLLNISSISVFSFLFFFFFVILIVKVLFLVTYLVIAAIKTEKQWQCSNVQIDTPTRGYSFANCFSLQTYSLNWKCFCYSNVILFQLCSSSEVLIFYLRTVPYIQRLWYHLTYLSVLWRRRELLKDDLETLKIF